MIKGLMKFLGVNKGKDDASPQSDAANDEPPSGSDSIPTDKDKSDKKDNK